ncbi:MAG: hypothetical protein GY765_21530, partial [bacterium]|nr:hypothetical protein [bacterium]
MSKKKILIVYASALYPVKMMTQVRIINLIKGLSKDHTVDVATFCHSPQDVAASREGLKGICNEFYPIKPLNPKKDFLRRKYYGLKY